MSNRLDDSIFGTLPRHHTPAGREAAREPAAHAPVTRGERRGAATETPAVGSGRRGRGGPGRGRRRLLLLLITLLVVGGGGYFAVHQLGPVFSSLFGAKDYEGEGSGSVRFVVNPGDTGRQIADNLVAAGVIMNAGPFEDALTAKTGKEIQPGTYAMRSKMSSASALGVLRDDGSRQVVRVTIPEGKRATEVYALLSKATGRRLVDYQAAAGNAAAIGLPAEAKGNAEGYLFPATYSFDPGDDAVDQLSTMVAQTRGVLDELGVPEAQRRRVVILGSLIEKEARLDVDRPKVARVLENRIAKKMPLQLDSTVKYPYPPDGKVTTTDAQRAAKNGYNTYQISGLPVGPIANPGKASLAAAMKPAAGSWLYFVTVNPTTGLTRFATTPAEHDANVRAFQSWCQANRGKC